MKTNILLLCSSLLPLILWLPQVEKGSNNFPIGSHIDLASDSSDNFKSEQRASKWTLQFEDSGTSRWQDHWFVDGELATIENTENGMHFKAGPMHRNDAHHAVLWTKKSFKGDIKIQYKYTRTDHQSINVNILFIQATGTGQDEFAHDIAKWNDYRKVPTMSKYWRNMNLIHISYAAFPMTNEDPENDYIRVRRYPATDKITFDETEVPPAFTRTGLFLPGITYDMTWIKTDKQLSLTVEGDGKKKEYTWDLSTCAPVSEGRIGLRHMFTRAAHYRDFKIYTQE